MLITNDIDKFLYADGAESLPGIEEAKQMIEELEEMSKNSKDLITDVEMTKVLIFSLMMIINLTIGE